MSSLYPIPYTIYPIPSKLCFSLLNPKGGNTLLHWASLRGHIEAIRFILCHNKAAVTDASADPLEFDVTLNPYATIAAISAVDNEGWSSLHKACDNNQVEAAVILIKAGIDFNLKTKVISREIDHFLK